MNLELRLLLGLGAHPDAARFSLVLTYLFHSVVWAAAVAVPVRVRVLSSATKNLYWKVALMGPLLTAPLAVAVDSAPWPARADSYVRSVAVPSFMMFSASEPKAEPSPGSKGSEAPPRAEAALAVQSRLVSQIGCYLGALGLLRFGVGALRLAHRLRRRTRVTDRRLLGCFDQFCARMGLRGVLLSESEQIYGPLVIGRREICLPSAIFAQLSQAELDGVLAHELAHIERADGVWFPIVGAVQSALWLQPLNLVLASCFRDSAEHACDERAIELTRDPLSLARALVQVAASASFARRSAMVPTMIRSRSALLPRVRRLTGGSVAKALPARERGRLQAVVTLTLLACLLGALSVRVAQARSTQAKGVQKTPSSPGRVDSLAPLRKVSEPSQRLAELAARERVVVARLEAMPQQRGATSEGSADSVQVLELSQELRHLREGQAWLEERAVAEASEGKSQSRGASR